MGLVSFKAGGGVLNTGYKPSSITNLTIKRSQKTAALTWTDPEDFTVDDTPCVWARTVLIRKTGSAPQSIHDGTEVAVITERNKYTETPWVDGVLELDVMYYYAAYVVSTDGVISDLSNIVSITIPTTRTMTVVIDLNDSNPETCGSYADNATDMPYGKTTEAIAAWQEFFGYRPCLFKNGQVVGYLNPNDYSKFEDGTPADITSGDGGDVMVEFPRRGIQISKTGKVITVTMTDDPDNPEFTYYAHTRISTKKDYFYLGAYRAATKSYSGSTSKLLVSLSNVDVMTGLYKSDYTEYAHNKGTGYEQMTWFQWIFIQVMYILQFKGNLNSQSTVGSGNMQAGASRYTGTLDQKGLIYGSVSEIGTDSSEDIKLFGLEDLWGEHWTFVECIFSYYDYIEVVKDPSRDDLILSEYDVTVHDSGFIDDAVCSPELGFFPTKYDGSGTTYFCDVGNISNAGDCAVGSQYSNSTNSPGIFCIYSDFTGSSSARDSTLGARLSYY